MPTRATPQPNQPEPDPNESVSRQPTTLLSGIPVTPTHPATAHPGAFGAPARPTIPLDWSEIDTQPMAAREMIQEAIRQDRARAEAHTRRAQQLRAQGREISVNISQMEACETQLHLDYQEACGWVAVKPEDLPPLTQEGNSASCS